MSQADEETAPTALARRLVAGGRKHDAEAVVARLIARNFGLVVGNVAITADWSSLNSLNGLVETSDGRRFFFKFHQEEGEEGTVEEYYRAELLQRAGLPVDMPVMMSRKPGHQILLYRFRRDRQLAAACLDVERSSADVDPGRLVELQADLDRKTGSVYRAALHQASADEVRREAIHQLFHHRLSDRPSGTRLAGRVSRFYLEQPVDLPGATLPWGEFAALRWRINGIDYRASLAELFEESLRRLAPDRLAGGAVIAHGDAHNANVWIEEGDGGARLVMFDPAFAGEHVPALLADIKATFHNIFAHPFWLYHPEEADRRFTVSVSLSGERIVVDHDWTLGALRRGFLDLKVEHVWRPLIAALRRRDLLPDDWRQVVRLALFCCPTLVMNLRAGAAHGATAGRSPAISALSFALAVMAGSEPEGGADPVSSFLDAIEPDATP
ncbi:MAG TPA: hypothetical protein VFK86_03440 [Bauldia sp.]|nr:hypothetical protein [Bauldia sp.]